MLTIRLQRTGRRNDPAFRIIAVEKASSPKVGVYTDMLGTYNPRTKAMTIAEERVKDWVSKGAQLSPTVSNLLITKGIIEGKKVQVISKTNLEKNVVKEVPVAEVAPAAEAEAPAETETAAPEAPAEETPAPEAAPEAAPAEEAPAAPAEEAAPAEAAPETPAA